VRNNKAESEKTGKNNETKNYTDRKEQMV